MTTGNNIKQLREKLKMTLETLGRKVGSSKSHLSLIENGHRNPSFTLACKLAKVLGVKRAQDLIEKDYE